MRARAASRAVSIQLKTLHAAGVALHRRRDSQKNI
jgi:hypothetical protein